MYNFTYHRPSGLRQAGNMLSKLEDAKLLAGGQTLIPVMKQRLASPTNIIDLNRIEGLSGIELKGRSIVIGAMTRHVEVASSDVVRQHLPALAELAEMVGDPQVRHMGTLGGSIANNDPNADYPAACLGLGATIITTCIFTSPGRGTRQVRAGRFQAYIRAPFPHPAGRARRRLHCEPNL